MKLSVPVCYLSPVPKGALSFVWEEGFVSKTQTQLRVALEVAECCGVALLDSCDAGGVIFLAHKLSRAIKGHFQLVEERDDLLLSLLSLAIMLQVSESVVEPLVWLAFFVAKQIGHL